MIKSIKECLQHDIIPRLSPNVPQFYGDSPFRNLPHIEAHGGDHVLETNAQIQKLENINDTRVKAYYGNHILEPISKQ